MKEVKDFEINVKTDMENLMKQYEASGGFVAKKIGTGFEILRDMFSEEKCMRILSFPACIMSTGIRGILKDMIKEKMFDIVITTCGTLDHDFSRVYKPYYHGSFDANDSELHKKKIHRLGNIFIPMSHHGGIIEEKLVPMLKDMYDKGAREISTYEFVWELGKRIEDENSLIYWCYKNQIPVIIPGITDGTFGTQLLMFMQEHSDFKINVFKDEEFLLGRMFGDFRSGALVLGGGISKHHTIWWNQFKGGLDYAVYITTAPEYDGSLSGARMKEGISWGKVDEKARYVTIEGDVTVILPIMAGALLKPGSKK
jgi:deoxyhypusine synthase